MDRQTLEEKYNFRICSMMDMQSLSDNIAKDYFNPHNTLYLQYILEIPPELLTEVDSIEDASEWKDKLDMVVSMAIKETGNDGIGCIVELEGEEYALHGYSLQEIYNLANTRIQWKYRSA